MFSPHTRWRLLEFLIMFVLLPALIAWLKPRGYVYIILWVLMAVCAQIMQHRYDWSFKHDWNFKACTRPVIRRIILRFIPFALGLVLFTWVMVPNELFSLPRHNFYAWIAIMLFYPPLSILPQEIVYRCFFLRRYTPLVRNPENTRILCALAFGWMHIIMMNWPAVLLTTIGGLLFADTYQRTRSLAAVCFEHLIYGCFAFTVGLGVFLFHGHAMH